jgi:hypothetical protein
MLISYWFIVCCATALLYPSNRTGHSWSHLTWILFLIRKQAFIRLSENAKKRIPVKNDKDSELVVQAIQLPNLDLFRDIAKIVGSPAESVTRFF